MVSKKSTAMLVVFCEPAECANALHISPADVFVAAPSALPLEKNNHASTQYINDFVASNEGKKRMRAYMKVPRDVQRLIAQLVERLALEDV